MGLRLPLCRILVHWRRTKKLTDGDETRNGRKRVSSPEGKVFGLFLCVFSSFVFFITVVFGCNFATFFLTDFGFGSTVLSVGSTDFLTTGLATLTGRSSNTRPSLSVNWVSRTDWNSRIWRTASSFCFWGVGMGHKKQRSSLGWPTRFRSCKTRVFCPCS